MAEAKTTDPQQSPVTSQEHVVLLGERKWRVVEEFNDGKRVAVKQFRPDGALFRTIAYENEAVSDVYLHQPEIPEGQSVHLKVNPDKTLRAFDWVRSEGLPIVKYAFSDDGHVTKTNYAKEASGVTTTHDASSLYTHPVMAEGTQAMLGLCTMKIEGMSLGLPENTPIIIHDLYEAGTIRRIEMAQTGEMVRFDFEGNRHSLTRQENGITAITQFWPGLQKVTKEVVRHRIETNEEVMRAKLILDAEGKPWSFKTFKSNSNPEWEFDFRDNNSMRVIWYKPNGKRIVYTDIPVSRMGTIVKRSDIPMLLAEKDTTVALDMTLVGKLYAQMQEDCPVPQDKNVAAKQEPEIELHPNGKPAKTTRYIKLGERDWKIVEEFDAHGVRTGVEQYRPDGVLLRSIEFENGVPGTICLSAESHPDNVTTMVSLYPDGTLKSYLLMHGDYATPGCLYDFNEDGTATKIIYERDGSVESSKEYAARAFSFSMNMTNRESARLGLCLMPIEGLDITLPPSPRITVQDIFPSAHLRRIDIKSDDGVEQIVRMRPDGTDYTFTFRHPDKTVIELQNSAPHNENLKARLTLEKSGLPKSLEMFNTKSECTLGIIFKGNTSEEMMLLHYQNGRFVGRNPIPKSYFGKTVLCRDVPALLRKNDDALFADLTVPAQLMEAMLAGDHPVPEEKQDVRTAPASYKPKSKEPAPASAPEAAPVHQIEDLGKAEHIDAKTNEKTVTYSRRVNGKKQDYKIEKYRPDGPKKTDGTKRYVEELNPDGSGEVRYYYAGCERDKEVLRTVLKHTAVPFEDMDMRLYLNPGQHYVDTGASKDVHKAVEDNKKRVAKREEANKRYKAGGDWKQDLSYVTVMGDWSALSGLIEMHKNDEYKRPLTLDLANVNEITEETLAFIRSVEVLLHQERLPKVDATHMSLEAIEKERAAGKRPLLLAGIEGRDPQTRARLQAALAPLLQELGDSVRIREAKHDGNQELPQVVLKERIEYSPAGKPFYSEEYDKYGEFKAAHNRKGDTKQPTKELRPFTSRDISLQEVTGQKR